MKIELKKRSHLIIGRSIKGSLEEIEEFYKGETVELFDEFKQNSLIVGRILKGNDQLDILKQLKTIKLDSWEQIFYKRITGYDEKTLAITISIESDLVHVYSKERIEYFEKDLSQFYKETDKVEITKEDIE